MINNINLFDLVSVLFSGSISTKYKSSNDLVAFVVLLKYLYSVSPPYTNVVCITIGGGTSWVLFVEMSFCDLTRVVFSHAGIALPRRSNSSCGYLLNSDAKMFRIPTKELSQIDNGSPSKIGVTFFVCEF